MSNFRKKKKRLINEAGKCHKCGSTEDLTIDHKISKSRGGDSKKENLQVLCNKCNNLKSRNEKHEFLEKPLHKRTQEEIRLATSYFLYRIARSVYAQQTTVKNKIQLEGLLKRRRKLISQLHEIIGFKDDRHNKTFS